MLFHINIRKYFRGDGDGALLSSVGYAKDNDVIKGNNNERYTVALNLNADLSPRIQLHWELMET